ncbi:MAG TPA: type II toxin-antitoxin system VapC family toxin [Ktedonobacteraceae bacterium]|jgi:predicted nucleic acid-binding protein|nr:type II toxin-antitoxin system VapC family toxin [Ktedonobacteraceae bacterium]
MNKIVVVDASIALKWAITEADSKTARALLAEWVNQGVEIKAPALLAYEITNILYREVRAGRISSDTAKIGIKLIFRTVKLVLSKNSSFNIRAMALAEHYGLPASYGAHYLAFAEQQGCELWTSDTRLWRSVKGQLDWVRTLESYSPSSS